MKLRVRGNSLRLRLTRQEVDQISRGEAIVEQTHFPDGTILAYELTVGADYHAQQLHTQNTHTLRIQVTQADASGWAVSEVVGLTGAEPLQLGPLSILIEKDFTCITPREGEEELDTYPNPNAA